MLSDVPLLRKHSFTRGKTLDARCVCFAESENKISSFVAGEFISNDRIGRVFLYTRGPSLHILRGYSIPAILFAFIIYRLSLSIRGQKKKSRKRERELRRGKKKREGQRDEKTELHEKQNKLCHWIK